LRKNQAGEVITLIPLQFLLAKIPEPIRRLAAINHRRQTRKAQDRLTRRPHEGVYWWIPIKKVSEITWEVVTYFQEDWYQGTEHLAIWPYVIEELEQKWGKLPRSIKENYTGLPRGRVCFSLMDGKRKLVLYHGNDTPIPDGLDYVRRQFSLPRGTPIRFDEHETMMQGDPEKVQKALGMNLNLKGHPFVMDYSVKDDPKNSGRIPRLAIRQEGNRGRSASY
jgi:hypothetical protein